MQKHMITFVDGKASVCLADSAMTVIGHNCHTRFCHKTLRKKNRPGLAFAGLNENPPFSFVVEVCAEAAAPNPPPGFPAATAYGIIAVVVLRQKLANFTQPVTF